MSDDTPMREEGQLDAIDQAFMLIADNILKHEIQRDGFHFDDECWLEDYAKARKLIEAALAQAEERAALATEARQAEWGGHTKVCWVNIERELGTPCGCGFDDWCRRFDALNHSGGVMAGKKLDPLPRYDSVYYEAMANLDADERWSAETLEWDKNQYLNKAEATPSDALNHIGDK